MRRRQGVVATAGGLIPFGHLGWGYHDRDEFRLRAAEYIADGLAQHQWVEYVGAGSREELRAELATLPGLADISGIKVTPTLEFYNVAAGSDIVDPQIAVATRVAAVETAIQRGYTGFRAISDVTPVAGRPEQRDAFARFEFLIDQKMAAFPVSALCAYDLGQLDGDASSLICLHPLASRSAPNFRLYAHPGTGFALAGELDAATDHAFSTALQRVWPLASGDTIVIDAHDVEFIGHRQLAILEHCGRADGRRVVVQTKQPILARLAEMLELTYVRVESTDDIN